MAIVDERDMERILVVVAHPDDAEFWVGGTVARWTGAGIAVTYCVLTDGENGGNDPAVPQAQIPAIRRAEQLKAAGLLNVTDVKFMGINEGVIDPLDQELHKQLVRLIRQVRPQQIVTWSPERNWERFRSCHPDHLATGEATLRALYPDAGNRFALPSLYDDEGLEAWTVSQAWLLNSPRVNHYVDVTSTFDRKVAAVAAHHSQVSDRDILESRLRERVAVTAAAGGMPPGRLAEAFQVVRTG